MPTAYTSNYFFEIDVGVVSMRHLVSTEETEVQRISLIGDGDADTIRRAFTQELFGPVKLDDATISDVRLPRQPAN
jgi:hypothetical protein